jgi:hypothetical protein
MMTREEHLTWCKQRALALVDKGELKDALASMGSDLNKHQETEGHAGIQLGVALLIHGHLDLPGEMRDFINGFN